MRVLLIDSPGASPWADDHPRLRSIADLCRHRFDVTERLAVARAGRPPIIAPCGREVDAAPLIAASAVFDLVKDEPPDLCIAPLRGGLAHGLLMARACGELPSSMRVAVIADDPTRDAILQDGDVGVSAMRALVADAMERVCLQEADALLAGPQTDLTSLHALGLDSLPPLSRCIDVSLGRAAIVRTGRDTNVLCFVGAFCRAAHVVTFIEAVESLASHDPGRIERVDFIGPINDAIHAPGKEWLGRRALGWPFPFRVIETDLLAVAVDHLRLSQGIAFIPDCPTALADRLRDIGAPPVWLDPATVRDTDRLRSTFTEMRETASTVSNAPASANAEIFCNALERIELRRPHRAGQPVRRPPSLSICLLHRDRPLLLRQALDSIFDQLPAVEGDVEILVLDNGSVRQDSAALLDELAADLRLKLVRQARPLPNSTSMNAMARHASSDFLVFLDDDNLMAEGGMAALLRACAADTFDVITSNLWLFDADRLDQTRVAKLAFIGPARTSGLFFNFFGDTCMAFRRSTFERIGGFHDAKAASPGPDWVLLARAQAAGASIGVLQEPAFHYRRNFDTADLSWQKYDQHGVRHLVHSHYGQSYDHDLVAKLAQHLMVEYYR